MLTSTAGATRDRDPAPSPRSSSRDPRRRGCRDELPRPERETIPRPEREPVHLSSWRQQLGARGATGLAPQKPGRKPKLDEKDRQLLAMAKENAVLKRKLLIANGLVALQKKAHEILGIALPEFDEESL